MSRDNIEVNIGGGFVSMLQILFIALKLCQVITWSWVMVLLPVIISSGLALLIVIGVVIVALVFG